jgi:MFS family permease
MFDRIYYGWWIVFACFLISFYVSGVIFYGFTAFIDPLAQEFGWSYAQISLAASLRGLETGILAPIVGFMVDRFGSKRLMLLGVTIVGCGIILLGLTKSIFMFYGAFVLIAFGAGGCTSVVSMTAVANWFDRNVGLAMGIMASGFGAAGLIVPLIVWLITAYGWRTALFILGVGLWVFGIPLTFLIRNNPEESPAGGAGSPNKNPVPSGGSLSPDREIGFKAAVRRRSFLLLNFAEVMRMMSLAAVVTHIMPYLSGLNISRSASGVMAAGIPVVSIIGRFVFGWLGDRFEKARVMAVAFSCMAVGMLAFALAEIGGMLYVFLFFFSTGFGGLAVLRGSFLREYYGRYSFGKLMGAMMGFSATGGIIGPTFGGWMFDRFGNYGYFWFFLCIMLGIAVLLILNIEPKSTDR